MICFRLNNRTWRMRNDLFSCLILSISCCCAVPNAMYSFGSDVDVGCCSSQSSVKQHMHDSWHKVVYKAVSKKEESPSTIGDKF
uniref:Secreted protein n=1 Tax=Setaria viridis TaxID=4556 RepID=A0A4U6VTH7_SETVI|nr:hypothetical protein SEVIR_2G154950v2 [Setaria viridis]